MEKRDSHKSFRRSGRLWRVALLTGLLVWMISVSASPAATIAIDAGRTWTKISPLLWGGSLPGWDMQEGVLQEPVMKAIQDLNITTLRFPGGLVGDGYHWQDGVGTGRPTVKDAEFLKFFRHRKGYVSNRVGTAEFMSLIRTLRAQPLFTVNGATGTAEEAAQWVEYCNGGPDTRFGGLRVSHGARNPYGVVYWEVGNELYGEWHAKRMTPDRYAKTFQQFTKAMKLKDPGIQVGLIGGLTKKHWRWTSEVLDKAGREADFLSFHLYYPQKLGQGLSDEDYAKMVMAAPLYFERQLKEVKDHPVVRSKNLKIAFSEYNLHYVGAHSLNEIRDLKSALSLAELYQVFIRQEVFMADIWAVYDNSEKALIRTGNGGIRMSPAYHVFSLYSHDFGPQVVDVRVQGNPRLEIPPFDQQGAMWVPTLSAMAALDPRGETLALIVVNKDQKRAITADVDLSGFPAGSRVEIRTVSGPDPDAHNDGGRETVFLESRVVEGPAAFTFPPLSVTKIRWEKALSPRRGL